MAGQNYDMRRKVPHSAPLAILYVLGFTNGDQRGMMLFQQDPENRFTQSKLCDCWRNYRVRAHGRFPCRIHSHFQRSGSTLALTNLHLTSAGGYQCVVSNSLGTVTSSSAILNISHPPLLLSASLNNNDSSVTLHLSGLAESGPIVLYSSTNLLDWVSIATNPPTFGSWDFSDSSINAPLKFYRASELQ